MDAKEFLKEWERMCNSTKCKSCGLLNSEACGGMPFGEVDFDEMVAKVEKWSKEHPLVTNGDMIITHIIDMRKKSYNADKIKIKTRWCDDWTKTIKQFFNANWWDAEYKEGSNDD